MDSFEKTSEPPYILRNSFEGCLVTEMPKSIDDKRYFQNGNHKNNTRWFELVHSAEPEPENTELCRQAELARTAIIVGNTALMDYVINPLKYTRKYLRHRVRLSDSAVSSRMVYHAGLQADVTFGHSNEVEDFLQEYAEQLTAHWHEYDPSLGRFSCFAVPRVRFTRQRMLRHGHFAIRLPGWLIASFEQKKYYLDLLDQNYFGDVVDSNEKVMAENILDRVDRITGVLPEVGRLDTDEPLAEEYDLPIIDAELSYPLVPAHDEIAEDQYDEINETIGLRSWLEAIMKLAKLNEREREIIKKHNGFVANNGIENECWTLKETGESLDEPITRERVRQIEARAYAKMRAAMCQDPLWFEQLPVTFNAVLKLSRNARFARFKEALSAGEIPGHPIEPDDPQELDSA